MAMHVRCQRALATAQLTIMAIQALAGLPSSQQLVHEPWRTTSSPSSELHRRGFKWIFRYGEPETVPLPSRLWLFGMYVVM